MDLGNAKLLRLMNRCAGFFLQGRYGYITQHITLQNLKEERMDNGVTG